MTPERTRLVTVSASYGAGGSVVAPALAERLGVPFLNRATTRTGGFEGREPCFERIMPEEAGLTPVNRLLASFIQVMPAGPTQSPPSSHHLDLRLRRQCEEGIHRLADANAGVILGRAAAVVLGKERGFHVRLDGPSNLRLVQGTTVEGVSPEQARTHMPAADRARTAYVRRLYRADPADPRYYHLMIDSTAIPLDTVIEIILSALSSFQAPPAVPSPAQGTA
ncbi:MAG TPA: cytidylate kinase-like family protein [Trebonia sp.]|jgi:cytidylate kinase|nr:cytidylate kinase-like family protein [Trebonia sp.]